jgi:hypothetical protein
MLKLIVLATSWLLTHPVQDFPRASVELLYKNYQYLNVLSHATWSEQFHKHFLEFSHNEVVVATAHLKYCVEWEQECHRDVKQGAISLTKAIRYRLEAEKSLQVALDRVSVWEKAAEESRKSWAKLVKSYEEDE